MDTGGVLCLRYIWRLTFSWESERSIKPPPKMRFLILKRMFVIGC